MIAATTVVRVTTSEMVSAEPNDGSVATATQVVERAAEREERGGGRLEHDVGQEGRVEHPVDGEGPDHGQDEGQGGEQGALHAGAVHHTSSFMSERT